MRRAAKGFSQLVEFNDHIMEQKEVDVESVNKKLKRVEPEFRRMCALAFLGKNFKVQFMGQFIEHMKSIGNSQECTREQLQTCVSGLAQLAENFIVPEYTDYECEHDIEIIGKKRKKHTKRDGPPTNYIYFMQQVRPQVVKENPGITFQEVAKELGRRWGCLTPEEKVQWRENAEADYESKKKAKPDYFADVSGVSGAASATKGAAEGSQGTPMDTK